MFYTNVFVRGNKVYMNGYDKGIRVKEVCAYKPYLFLPSKEKTKFKTLDGQYVQRMEFSDISDAREFLNTYSDVSNMSIYGLNKYAYTYIYDNFKGEIDYDPRMVNIGNIDLECAADEGFPNIQKADKEITAITLKSKGRYYVFGCGEYITDNPNVFYVNCENESELLMMFIDCWRKLDLDIITGWNCIPTDQFVWGKNQILPISQIKDVYNNLLVNTSPVAPKNKYEITLANGKMLYTSKDHKLIVKEIPSNKYTTLETNNKNKKYLIDKVLTTEECMNSTNSLFVQYPLRTNDNEDCNYTNAQLYLAGLIYTDGSLKDNGNIRNGFQIYQSDLDMLNDIKNIYNIDTTCVGPYKNNYALYIKHSLIDAASNLIYIDNKKKLNVPELSKLSYSQFMIFLSGLLDGDGCASPGNISFCNYNDDIQPLNDLLQWNGIFAIQQSENILRLVDYNFHDLSLLKKNRWNFVPNLPLKRNTSQKAGDIRFKKIGKDYFVKISSIKKTDIICDMMDIETQDHTFVTNGVVVHNCEFFDVPYLINRIIRVLGEKYAKRLSPIGIVDEKTTSFMGKENQSYVIAGISVLDYYHLYRKFKFGNQESYKLDFIAQVELGEKKIDYNEYGSLLELYRKNFQKFMEYNIKDVDLVDKLDDKLKFLEQVMALAYDAKVNYVDTLTTVLPWDIIIHNYLLDKGIVVPQMKKQSMDGGLVGGYVKDPKIGLSKWVVSFDLTSLYPSLIQQYNISPEKMISKDKVKSMIKAEKLRRRLI